MPPRFSCPSKIWGLPLCLTPRIVKLFPPAPHCSASCHGYRFLLSRFPRQGFTVRPKSGGVGSSDARPARTDGDQNLPGGAPAPRCTPPPAPSAPSIFQKPKLTVLGVRVPPPQPPGSPRLLPLVVFVPLEVGRGDGGGLAQQDALLPHRHPGALRVRDVWRVCGEDGSWGSVPPTPLLSPLFFPHVQGGKIISEPMPSSSYSHTSFPGGFGRGTQSTS